MKMPHIEDSILWKSRFLSKEKAQTENYTKGVSCLKTTIYGSVSPQTAWKSHTSQGRQNSLNIN